MVCVLNLMMIGPAVFEIAGLIYATGQSMIVSFYLSMLIFINCVALFHSIY